MDILSINWGTVRDIVITGYTVWKWRTEVKDRRKKERDEEKNSSKHSPQ